MQNRLKNIVVILAGGVGKRAGYSEPKQFFKIAGKTVLEHTVSRFERSERIDEIIIVVHSQYIKFVERLVLKNGWLKVDKILNGGSERYESSLSAITAIGDQESNVIFHDAVRPMVSKQIINNVIDALDNYKAVDVAVAQTDTVVECDDDLIVNIPNRARLFSGQTPQAFKLSVIKEAYRRALQDPEFTTTDDCGVVKRYLPEEKIFVVPGDVQNIKLTYREDIYLLDKIFQIRSQILNQSVKRASLEGKVAVVYGGSYGIGLAVAQQLEDMGCKVFSFSRSQGGVDISSIESIEQSLQEVYAQTQRIDFVINSAAIMLKKPLVSCSQDEIISIINTNYLGMVNVASIAHSYLKQTKGVLLLYTSSSYTRGRAFYSLYSSTKAAVVNFTQAIADEWASDHIKVNCICPERTKTPMRTQHFGIEDDSTLLTAESVAEVSIEALLTDDTGQIYNVKR